MLRMSSILVVLIGLLVASFGHAAVTFKNCSRPQEEKLSVAMKALVPTIKEIRQEIKSRYGNLAGQDSSSLSRQKKLVKNADKMLSCSQRVAATNLIFECAPELARGALASTLPLIGKTISYSYAALDYQNRQLTAIILHEVTHKCGANDAAYFNYDAPTSTTFFDWSTIADTYHYWGNNGFCTPEYDCI